MQWLPLIIGLAFLAACAPKMAQPVIFSKAETTSDQIDQDRAQCAFEVVQHLPRGDYKLPKAMLNDKKQSREALCMVGKGYKVYMGQETERIVDCRLRDGAVNSLSISACADANGQLQRQSP